MCAQAESEALELFLVVAKESSKRRSGRGGSQGGAGRLACQSPRETPAWLFVHKAVACASLACSQEAPYAGPPAYFNHILACVAYFNVYICHIIAVKASMSENGGVWFTLGACNQSHVFKHVARGLSRSRPRHHARAFENHISKRLPSCVLAVPTSRARQILR